GVLELRSDHAERRAAHDLVVLERDPTRGPAGVEFSFRGERRQAEALDTVAPALDPNRKPSASIHHPQETAATAVQLHTFPFLVHHRLAEKALHLRESGAAALQPDQPAPGTLHPVTSAETWREDAHHSTEHRDHVMLGDELDLLDGAAV